MYKKIIALFSLVIFISSCGTKKEAFEIEDAAASRVIANHYQEEAQFETLCSRMRLKYQDEVIHFIFGIGFNGFFEHIDLSRCVFGQCIDLLP